MQMRAQVRFTCGYFWQLQLAVVTVVLTLTANYAREGKGKGKGRRQPRTRCCCCTTRSPFPKAASHCCTLSKHYASPGSVRPDAAPATVVATTVRL